MSTLREWVLALLEKNGPMTAAELTFELGLNYRLGGALTRMQKTTPRCPRCIHIAYWVRDEDVHTKRIYLRPVYAAGDKPDAKKPPVITMNEAAATSKQRKRGRVNFIFNVRHSWAGVRR